MGCGIIVLQSVNVSSFPEHHVLGISSRFLSILTALCPDQSNPANGVVSQSGNSEGDTATYTCNDGYELVGSETLNCQSDGNWDDVPPVCRREFQLFIFKVIFNSFFSIITLFQQHSVQILLTLPMV